MAGMRNPRNRFLRLNQFPSKKSGTFDFGTTVGCVNNALTYCCSHKYQLDEAG